MTIFVAHGSRDPKWRASIEAVIASLQDDLGPDAVRLAYMEHGPPTLLDVASEVVRTGAAAIDVVPLFLAEQGHVDRTIRPMVEQLGELLEGVAVELRPPVGQHPGFRKLLHEIALAGAATTVR